MTDTNTRDRWSGLEEFPDGKEGVQSRYVIVHQLRASADIQADEITREWGRPATTDRAELMRRAANLVEALISHARAVEAENARLRGAVEPLALLAVDEDGQGGALMTDPLSKWFTIGQLVEARDALANRAALTEPRAGEAK